MCVYYEEKLTQGSQFGDPLPYEVMNEETFPNLERLSGTPIHYQHWIGKKKGKIQAFKKDSVVGRMLDLKLEGFFFFHISGNFMCGKNIQHHFSLFNEKFVHFLYVSRLAFKI